MKTSDLFAMFDLGARKAAKNPEPLFVETSDAGPEDDLAPASPTALNLDEWTYRQGQELLDFNPAFRATKLGPDAIADCYGAAFETEPVLNDRCVDSLRQKFFEQLFETPDYRALHDRTFGDQIAAESAALSYAESLGKLVRERAEKERKKCRGGKGIPSGKPAGLDDEEADVLSAVCEAIDKASEEVEKNEDIAVSFGMGPGSPGSNDPKAIANLFKRVRGNELLEKICNQAGKFIRFASGKQRQKVSHGMDDVVGVTVAGEIARLVPAELLKFSIPELELDLLRRINEQQAICREHKSIEPVGKGPILIVLDESGSMIGNKIETAKAIALALAWISRCQNRWCGLIAYSGDSGHRLLALPPKERWDEEKLCHWLTEFIGCGSALDIPVVELPDFYNQIGAPKGKTDVVIVTDAQCHIREEMAATFNDWKKSVGARVTSIVVKGSTEGIDKISDEFYRVEALSASEEAIEKVLSI